MFESGSLRIDVKDIMMRAGSRYRGLYNMILTIQNQGHSTTDHSDLHHHVTDFAHFWPKGIPSGGI